MYQINSTNLLSFWITARERKGYPSSSSKPRSRCRLTIRFFKILINQYTPATTSERAREPLLIFHIFLVLIIIAHCLRSRVRVVSLKAEVGWRSARVVGVGAFRQVEIEDLIATFSSRLSEHYVQQHKTLWLELRSLNINSLSRAVEKLNEKAGKGARKSENCVESLGEREHIRYENYFEHYN